VLWTSAVASIAIVTGRGPQLKVITPPAATAATTACEVQLRGRAVADDVVRVAGADRRPAAGTKRVAGRVPAAGSRTGVGDGLGLGLGLGAGSWTSRRVRPPSSPPRRRPPPRRARSVTPAACRQRDTRRERDDQRRGPALSRTRPHVRSLIRDFVACPRSMTARTHGAALHSPAVPGSGRFPRLRDRGGGVHKRSGRARRRG
jgi:hypothetical protein